jgi:tetratricopeptide (TPR) repeat protein
MSSAYCCKLSLALVGIVLFGSLSSRAAEQKWLRINSDHFLVLTDAGQKRGHEIVARFEQMRAVFADLLSRKQVRMAEPIEIIAIADPQKFAQLAPPAAGQPNTAPGFFLAGEDRIFIVLNASNPDCWRAIEHPLAHFLLNYNYPPTQPWFDEGFAEYFASLYFTPQKTELGSDPEMVWRGQSLPQTPTTLSSGPGLKSLTELLDNPVWLSLTDLLEMKNRMVNGEEGTHHTLFYAQSWMLVHYLISKDKLPETGKYFELVENEKLPVPQAVEQAFGMSATQLDGTLKDYFHSLKPLAASLDESKQPNPPLYPEPVNESPLPFAIDDIGASASDVPLPEALALVDEMELRIPEHREQATEDLEKLISDPHTETVIAHRALAWADIEKRDSKEAFEELNDAMTINASDPWTRFATALASYRSGEKGAKIQGLANMMESLRIVIDRNPEFAEAYNMLGWAQLEGGGSNAALATMKIAVQLAPRNQLYELRLAQAYVGAKKWDDGLAILEHLKGSPDPQIAAAAKQELYEVPYLRKYGIAPQETAATSSSGGATTPASTQSAQQSEPAKPAESDDSSSDDESQAATKPVTTEPKIDKRPIQFVKGKLLSVDCSQAPAAVLLVLKGARTLRLRTPDYQSLLVLGTGKFSCDWKNLPVTVNYRAQAKAEGDLVSIEVQ